MNTPSNLLDESLGLRGGAGALPPVRVVLVEDRVETSGAFVLHHLMKRALSPQGSGAVIFVALAQPFSHYDRILRKLGCNLSLQRNNNRLHFFDMIKLEFPGEIGRDAIESGFVELYTKIQRAAEACSRGSSKGSITIIIDDLSLLEIPAHGFVDHVLDFLHYCITLTSELDCSLVLLIHEDIYSSVEAPSLLLHLEYLADIIIRAEPLATGLAADVHGQLTVAMKGIFKEHGHSMSKISNFHFKVKENGVEYFYPGSRS